MAGLLLVRVGETIALIVVTVGVWLFGAGVSTMTFVVTVVTESVVSRTGWPTGASVGY